MSGPSFDVVVPTAGRPTLAPLLRALAQGLPRPGRVVVVDDRPGGGPPLLSGIEGSELPAEVVVFRSRGAGPAAARNVGWRAATAEWVAFLDDDVVLPSGWLEALAKDLGELPADVAGSQGRIVVPLSVDRRPTDWERNVKGLETAVWATADMVYRRDVLAALGGFDERFERAYREDADLGLRVTSLGRRIERGRRTVQHPAAPERFWRSVALQRGNADDVLMRALHGPRWRERAHAQRGRRRRHLATTAAGVIALVGVAARSRGLAAAGLAGWLAGTAELTWARLRPGPRGREEVAHMTATSIVLPAAATYHWLRGWARLPRVFAEAERAPRLQAERARPEAVLLDRDGTLVVDVPYNGDPRRVKPMPGAREALDRLRAAGVKLAVISNQSGVGRGVLRVEEVEAVNRRVEELVGPVGGFFVCLHAPDAGCDCRKPAPGLVRRAAGALGTTPGRCVVVGDIGSDVEAALAAGARPVLVPNLATREEEVAAAPEVAPDLLAAVDLVLGRNGS